MADPRAASAAEIALLEELRLALLWDFKRLALANELTPTDRRTLAAMLKDNNMLLDPNALPQDLRSKLSCTLAVDADLDDDANI